MNSYKFIILEERGAVGHIILNRPEVHNALNIEMIRELTTALRWLDSLPSIRLIQISANGPNFSAGADLNWMKKGLSQSKEELTGESRELAMLFNTLYNSSKTTVVVVTGKVIGGANGIVAAADITASATDATFAFTEVKLGLVPATIAPYIIEKTAAGIAQEWMLTGRTIPSAEANLRGLINFVYPPDQLENEVEKLTEILLRNGPSAMEGIKKMFRNRKLFSGPDTQIEETAALIALFRTSPEGQEGISAFFEKRQPAWRNE